MPYLLSDVHRTSYASQAVVGVLSTRQSVKDNALPKGTWASAVAWSIVSQRSTQQMAVEMMSI